MHVKKQDHLFKHLLRLGYFTQVVGMGLGFINVQIRDYACAPLGASSILAAIGRHSSRVRGGESHPSGAGVERSCCICGLTVLGIGNMREGISRGSGTWLSTVDSANETVNNPINRIECL